MKRIICILFLVLLAAPAMAQITRTFAWDASASASTAPPGNPVKYRLMKCTDQALTACTVVDAGTALQADLTLTDGTCYILARAYWFALVVDGIPQGTDTVESGNSNVLRAEVKIPPGNPGNARIKITQVAASISGQRLRK